jgi:hypothetical protein
VSGKLDTGLAERLDRNGGEPSVLRLKVLRPYQELNPLQCIMNKNTLPSSTEVALLIKNRLQNFWGYGNLKGKIWFVGMEEGIGADEPFPLERFISTKDKVVTDIRDNTSPDHQRWFKLNAPTQNTYRPLIYILMYLRLRRMPKIQDVRMYQFCEFGLANNTHALLELMPLPSRSVKAEDWLYSEVPLEGLKTRKEYLKKYKPARTEALKALIEKHQPKLVLFYSRSYLNDWQHIIPEPLNEIIPGKLHMVKCQNTTYAVTAHPTSRGMKTSDWEEIASKIFNRH